MSLTKTPLTNNQLQVVLTGKLGDGILATNGRAKMHPEVSYPYYYQSNSIYYEYVAFKKRLLGNLCRSDIRDRINGGYKANHIFTIATVSHPQITEIAKESLIDSLNRLDELGLALWFYDDGSLHQKKLFYNLNTQSFSKDENVNIIAPFLKDRFGITAKPTIERKADGREFWYLRIPKYTGTFVVSDILERYPVSCFNYKIIGSDVVSKWNLLNLQLQKENIDPLSLHPKTLCSMLNKITAA